MLAISFKGFVNYYAIESKLKPSQNIENNANKSFDGDIIGEKRL